MKSSPSQLNMHYGNCPKKAESRQQTIINTYQSHYNSTTIPPNSQYWSICGRCSYEPNILEPNCEPFQIVKSNLIQPYQFHGVEINPEIYNWNKNIKNCNNQLNWHQGDFYETMITYANHNPFNPAIVNLDMLLMPKYGVQYFSKIMHLLTTNSNKTMLIGNFIKDHRHFRHSINNVIDGLQKEPLFQFSMNNANWSFYKDYYWYNGTGKTTTKMMSIILFKE